MKLPFFLYKTLKFIQPQWIIAKGYYRKAIQQMRKKLTLLTKDNGIPDGLSQTTLDWMCFCQKLEDYKVIYPNHTIFRQLPKTLSEVHWKFKQQTQHKSPSAFVAAIDDGRVWGNSGAVIAPDNQLLADVSKEIATKIEEHSIFLQWKLPPISRVAGTVAVLAASKGNTYFHWVFDVLPRLALLYESNISLNQIDKFVVNKLEARFQIDTLNLLGIEPERIIETSSLAHIQAEKLIVPSLPGISGNMPKWACDFIRDKFLLDRIARKENSLERIYISRANAKGRRITNEAEVIELLNSFGFKKLILETMSFIEQISLFAAAEIIVAPHGAGLSNLVFCKQGTKVIEIFSPNSVNICYWSLSNQLELDYYYLLAEGNIPPEHIDPGLGREDIVVSMERLVDILHLAIK